MKKLKKLIRSLIIRWVAKHFGCEIVNQWVYFGYNYPSSNDLINKCWGDFSKPGIAQHFYQKFDHIYDTYGCHAIMNRFWVELSLDHREKLYKYFLKNYANSRL
ncbi:MAG: hypothetical protein IKQ20_03595 [Bacteroidales bacterium]|nr:hypothetical protein [Bacteroidales bacterium]